MTDFNTQAAALCLSDMHKDAYGYRPRNNFDDGSWTQERFDRFVAGVGEDLALSIAADKVLDAEALAAYIVRLDAMVADHGISRAEAIRWDMQAEESEDDAGYYFFLQGLSSIDSAPFKTLIEG